MEGADAVTAMGMQRMMRPWKARTPSPPWECSGGCALGRYHGEKVYPPFLPLGIRGAEHTTDDPTAQKRRSETEFLWKGKKNGLARANKKADVTLPHWSVVLCVCAVHFLLPPFVFPGNIASMSLPSRANTINVRPSFGGIFKIDAAPERAPTGVRGWTPLTAQRGPNAKRMLAVK